MLGSWQILEWKILGHEINVGFMTFAGALLMLQRTVRGKDRETE